MLNHDDGPSLSLQLLDDGHRAGDLSKAQPREKLIQNDELRPEGQASGQLQTFEISMGQDARRLERNKGIPLEAHLFEEIDGNRVALIGFSIAASIAGSILTQEPRFAAAALVMGGAEQHKIMAYCSGPRLTAVRERVARDFGWGAEDLEKHLEPIMRNVDAANYSGQIDPEKVLIVDASRDDCMPRDCRESLWNALGRPERLTMNYDHRRAFYSITPLGFNWLRYRIWDFLESRLVE